MDKSKSLSNLLHSCLLHFTDIITRTGVWNHRVLKSWLHIINAWSRAKLDNINWYFFQFDVVCLCFENICVCPKN